MFNTKSQKSPLEDILVDLPHICDERGALSFVQQDNFHFERAFWIYSVPEDAERGGHAHRTCTELLMAVHGSFDLELHDGSRSVVLHLSQPYKAAIIRPMVWCRLFNFSPDFVGLCLASQDYQPEGYINTFEEFIGK